MQDALRIHGSIHESQTFDETPAQGGHAVRVTIIQGGRSSNGYVYNEQALRSIARMVEGAHAYADHGNSDGVTRSVKDVVGFYHDASYIAPGQDNPNGRVDATLHILEAASWLWSIIREACSLGRPELIGLSIDIFGQWQPNTTTRAREITQVLSLNSCDIVTRPSAGGSFRRILHSDQHNDLDHDQTTQAMYHTSSHSLAYQQGAAMNDPMPVPSADDPIAISAPPVTTETMTTTVALTPPAQQETFTHLSHLIEQVKLEHASLLLARRLHESPLPQAVKDGIDARYSNRIFEERELEQDLEAARTMMAKLAQDGLVRGHSYEKPDIGTQITEAEKIQAAFDRMFDLDIDSTRLGYIRGFSSIREAYARVTGDHSLQSGITSQSLLGDIRVSESAPIGRVTEADTTTASFSYLLGTSMNKRLLKDYQAWPAEWQKFVTIAPIRDFKQQSRVRLGAFGSLPVVAEDTAYSTVTLTDSAATYVPQKRGNLMSVSRETIVNDDLQAIKQIPTKLAVAAAYTLAEFVYGFLSANGNIYDGSALFGAGAPHNNLGSSALSTSAMQTGITTMREQTNYAGKRLGLRPRYLVVPPELEWIAMVATKSAGVPGSPNNDINPMLGYVTPIVAPQLTSTTQWFLVGDPREIDTIEIGFVGGQVNPALFIQDQPLFGLNFTQDVISYKIRHEYGGTVVDYRGLYRGI